MNRAHQLVRPSGLFVLLCAFLVVTGCGSSIEEPERVYERYNALVVKGLAYDDEVVFFTPRRRAEVEAKIPAYMKQMGKTADEVKKVYASFAQQVALCKQIKLLDKTFSKNGEEVTLTYEQTDTCAVHDSGTERQVVKMDRLGNRWLIDDIEISL